MKFDTDALQLAIRGKFKRQKDFGTKIGLTQQQLSNLLARGEKMKISQLMVICEAIGVDAEHLPQFFVD